MFLLQFLLIVAGFWIGAQTSAHADDPPELARWESNMTQYGQKWCNLLQDSSLGADAKLPSTYYDAERVYYQIADYTGDQRWVGCAQAAEQVYRDSYVLPHNGSVPGFWLFAQGLWMDFKRSQDPQSQQAVQLLAANAAYGNAFTAGIDITVSSFSRETAYNLEAKIFARDLGVPGLDAAINWYAEKALGDMDQWFVSKNAPFIEPFMVGLTSEALILYYSKSGDARVPPMIRTAVDYLWNNLWVASAQAFLYIDRAVDSEGGQGAVHPAPDLNLLIAPAFAWVYRQTGDASYAQRGDQIFAGGVTQAAVDFEAKQFDQNYRWSFAYVAWRQGKGDVITGGGAGMGSGPRSSGSYAVPDPSAGTGNPRSKGAYQ